MKNPSSYPETGHFGDEKCAWIEEVTFECLKALESGVEVEGICIYPVINTPVPDNLKSNHDCGMWELDRKKRRWPHADYIRTVRDCIQIVENNRMSIFSFNFLQSAFSSN
ncbi:hypothetical protein [Flavobacterium sp. 3HN19-14]|uniref:hypothetical protein n=1 Tax=Flavobacterium sp. 3HN19-14 TaxID=3448133 RepID=UPI003EE03EA0